MIKHLWLPGTLLCSLLSGIPAGAQVLPLELTAALEQYPKQLHSARMQFAVDQELGDAFYRMTGAGREDNPALQRHRVDFAFQGARYYDHTIPIDAQGNAIVQKGKQNVEIRIYDGKRRHVIQKGLSVEGEGFTYDAVQNEKRTAVDNPMEFGYWYSSNWLITELRAGEVQAVERSRDPKFGEVWEITWKNRRGVDRHGRFARDYGFLAVRLEIGPSGEGVSAHHSVLECTEVGRSGSFYFPAAGVYEWNRLSGGPDALLVRRRFRTEQWEPNQVDASLFTPNLPPHAVVWDADAQRKYQITGAGERLLDERMSVDAAKLPLRWLFILSLTALIVVLVGFLKRWHLRSHTS